MTNHVHLLLETTDYEVGKFMKFLSERYAMYIIANTVISDMYLRVDTNHVW